MVQKTMSDFFSKKESTRKVENENIGRKRSLVGSKDKENDQNAIVQSFNSKALKDTQNDSVYVNGTDKGTDGKATYVDVSKRVRIAADLSVSVDTDSLEAAMGDSWLRVLSDEFEKQYFKRLKAFLATEAAAKKKVYPPPEFIYEWTRICTFDDVKVVILGQDPYHRKGQAHGLSFSVVPGIATPPSLVNIYKELTADIAGFKRPSHGYLVEWAKQGVLLLNACLTVREGEANAHANKGWENFTDAVIKQINVKKSNVVFLLWGAYAQKKGAMIDKKKHCIVKTVHPSPLSAHRGFLGSKCFSKCNEYLSDNSITPIDWTAVCE
eukprot:CFRG6206T1